LREPVLLEPLLPRLLSPDLLRSAALLQLVLPPELVVLELLLPGLLSPDLLLSSRDLLPSGDVLPADDLLPFELRDLSDDELPHGDGLSDDKRPPLGMHLRRLHIQPVRKGMPARHAFPHSAHVAGDDASFSWDDLQAATFAGASTAGR